jgi:GMP synthase PP-ATPase subunit
LNICKILKEHCQKLLFTAEQVEKLRNEFCVQYTLLADDLKKQIKNRKVLTVEYVHNVDCLKNTGKIALIENIFLWLLGF